MGCFKCAGSQWTGIKVYVPPASILGPLCFLFILMTFLMIYLQMLSSLQVIILFFSIVCDNNTSETHLMI